MSIKRSIILHIIAMVKQMVFHGSLLIRRTTPNIWRKNYYLYPSIKDYYLAVENSLKKPTDCLISLQVHKFVPLA